MPKATPTKDKSISIRRLIVVCFCLMQAMYIEANVIGFDLGTSFFKITLVKPG